MMVFFNNTTMELWEYNEGASYDIYGEKLVTYSKVGEYSCDFQAKSMNESHLEIGEVKTDQYNVYFDLTVPLTNSMLLRVKNTSDTYEIIGSVEKWNSVVPHWRCTVQKQRTPTTLTSGDS